MKLKTLIVDDFLDDPDKIRNFLINNKVAFDVEGNFPGKRSTVVDNTNLRTEVAANNFNLCISQVTDMDNLFLNDSTFNSNINFWDTSSLTTMQNTFKGAIIFDQPLDNWNVLNVTEMSYMFDDARLFNQDIGSWTTSNVTDMRLYSPEITKLKSGPLGLYETDYFLRFKNKKKK